MEIIIKDSFFKINFKDKDLWYIRMGTYIKEIGKTIKRMGKVTWNFQTINLTKLIKVNGSMISSMGEGNWDSSLKKISESILVIGKKIKNKDLGFLSFLMGISIREISKMIFKKV